MVIAVCPDLVFEKIAIGWGYVPLYNLNLYEYRSMDTNFNCGYSYFNMAWLFIISVENKYCNIYIYIFNKQDEDMLPISATIGQIHSARMKRIPMAVEYSYFNMAWLFIISVENKYCKIYIQVYIYLINKQDEDMLPISATIGQIHSARMKRIPMAVRRVTQYYPIA